MANTLGANQIIWTNKASLTVPNLKRSLVQSLDLDVHQTDRIMIVGPSGCGKTSLLRMFSGLWKPSEGACRAKSFQQGVIFVPQRPYLFTASLSELLHYRSPSAPLAKKDLAALLNSVNLAELLDQHPDTEQPVEWQRVLSVGEQQRIAFARVLLSGSQFALLDEAKSALDPNNERSVYQLLKRRGMGYISIGHRSSLIEHHEKVLKLDTDGCRAVMPAQDFSFDD